MGAIKRHLSQVSEGMTLLDVDEVEMAVQVLKLVRKNGGTVYLFGNGGSHATASHFANDLMKMARVRAVCLGDLVPTTSAYGNDEEWENMFRAPLEKLLKWGDGMVGISCSGNSKNVMHALEYADARSITKVGLTGLSNSSWINNVGLDALVHAPALDIRVQEDLHLMVCHMIIRTMQEEE